MSLHSWCGACAAAVTILVWTLMAAPTLGRAASADTAPSCDIATVMRLSQWVVAHAPRAERSWLDGAVASVRPVCTPCSCPLSEADCYRYMAEMADAKVRRQHEYARTLAALQDALRQCEGK